MAALQRTRAAAAIAGTALLAAAAEMAMGRSALCPCGRVRLWTGAVRSAENSQQLLDWYSLTHVVHGLLLYASARLALPRRPVAWRLALAVAAEAGWEVLENSPVVIDRYRAVTMAYGYSGDSVLNSMGDVACMALGFALARRLPALAAAALGVALELVALAAIRDDLTLNVLMLVHPVAAIRAWQANG